MHALTVTSSLQNGGKVVSTPAGIDCGLTCTASFEEGTAVSLAATPYMGNLFTGWTGGNCAGTGNCTVTIGAATNVQASYAREQVQVDVSSIGNGTGTITSNPAGISCGTDCSGTFGHMTTLTLTASPAVGTRFDGWSGCAGPITCTLVLNGVAPLSIGANFTVQTFELSVGLLGNGGLVTSVPSGIGCLSDCLESYAFGTAVTLSATPIAGNSFTGWTGAGCSGTGTCTVAMTATRTVFAAFTPSVHALSISVTGSGAGSVASMPDRPACSGTCTNMYVHGERVFLSTITQEGSVFVGWGGACSGTATCVFDMTAAASVTAEFALVP